MIFSPEHDEIVTAFQAFNLADVLWSLNRELHATSSGEPKVLLSTFPTSSEHPGLLQWACGETARIALRHCRQPSYALAGETVNQLDPEDLGRLMNGALRLLTTERFLGSSEAGALIEQGDVFDTISRLLEPQALLQRGSPFRASLPILMYEIALRRRKARDSAFDMRGLQAKVEEALGCSIRSFALATVQAASHAARSLVTFAGLVPVQSRAYDETALYANGAEGLLQPVAGHVLRLLSAQPHTMLEWMRNSHEETKRGTPPRERDDERTLLEGPNPLLRFPLVQVFRDRPDYCIAPVPSLVQEWLYEPLATFLNESVAPEMRIQLNLVFEEHVGSVLELSSPDGLPWIHERELIPKARGKVVDWAREFDNDVVLVDAKRGFVSLGARYRSVLPEWNSVVEHNWAKAVNQAASFWKNVRAGNVPALTSARNKRPILLIVTLSDGDLRAGRHDVDELIRPHLTPGDPLMPYAVVSIDRLEMIASNWASRDREWLPALLRDASTFGATAAVRDLEFVPGGRLEEAFTDVLDELLTAVDPK
jgi:hypothetical protein